MKYWLIGIDRENSRETRFLTTEDTVTAKELFLQAQDKIYAGRDREESDYPMLKGVYEYYPEPGEEREKFLAGVVHVSPWYDEEIEAISKLTKEEFDELTEKAERENRAFNERLERLNLTAYNRYDYLREAERARREKEMAAFGGCRMISLFGGQTKEKRGGEQT